MAENSKKCGICCGKFPASKVRIMENLIGDRIYCCDECSLWMKDYFVEVEET